MTGIFIAVLTHHNIGIAYYGFLYHFGHKVAFNPIIAIHMHHIIAMCSFDSSGPCGSAALVALVTNNPNATVVALVKHTSEHAQG